MHFGPTLSDKNDCLKIDKNNQHVSLVEPFSPVEGWVRSPCTDKKLIEEYFSSQFLISMEFPTPRIRFTRENDNTWIDSCILNEFKYFNFHYIDQSTHTVEIEYQQYRLHPSNFIYPIIRLVVQTKNDYKIPFFVQEHGRIYFIGKEQNIGSHKMVSESEVWDQLEKVDNNVLSKSTLEQQLAIVKRLEYIIEGEPSLLHQIFFNTRVDASWKLNDAYREELYNTWLSNAKMIISAYKTRYTTLYNTYSERENIRERLAATIKEKLEHPNEMHPDVHQELVSDLRSKCFFSDPCIIEKKILEDAKEILRILDIEQNRVYTLILREAIEKIIVQEIEGDEKHIFPFDRESILLAYKMHAQKFIEKNIENFALKQTESFFKNFQKRYSQSTLRKAFAGLVLQLHSISGLHLMNVLLH